MSLVEFQADLKYMNKAIEQRAMLMPICDEVHPENSRGLSRDPKSYRLAMALIVLFVLRETGRGALRSGHNLMKSRPRI